MHELSQMSIDNAGMVDEICTSVVGTLRKRDEYTCKKRLLAKQDYTKLVEHR